MKPSTLGPAPVLAMLAQMDFDWLQKAASVLYAATRAKDLEERKQSTHSLHCYQV